MKQILQLSIFTVTVLLFGCSHSPSATNSGPDSEPNSQPNSQPSSKPNSQPSYKPDSQPSSQSNSEPDFEIVQIKGNLYRGRSGVAHTAFLVTTEGVILGDPLSLEFAAWLKAQITERFDSEVRYVLYSHHHWDHAAGGAVFRDSAEFVGHENMVFELLRPLPSNYRGLDRNGNNLIDRHEGRGGLAAAL